VIIKNDNRCKNCRFWEHNRWTFEPLYEPKSSECVRLKEKLYDDDGVYVELSVHGNATADVEAFDVSANFGCVFFEEYPVWERVAKRMEYQLP